MPPAHSTVSWVARPKQISSAIYRATPFRTVQSPPTMPVERRSSTAPTSPHRRERPHVRRLRLAPLVRLWPNRYPPRSLSIIETSPSARICFRTRTAFLPHNLPQHRFPHRPPGPRSHTRHHLASSTGRFPPIHSTRPHHSRCARRQRAGMYPHQAPSHRA